MLILDNAIIFHTLCIRFKSLLSVLLFSLGPCNQCGQTYRINMLFGYIS